MTSNPAASGRPAVHAGRQPFLAVEPAALRTDRLLPFDLYMQTGGRMTLYHDRSLPFTEEVRRRLSEDRAKQVYIHESQRADYLGYVEGELPSLLGDGSMASSVKAHIVYSTSKGIAETIFSNPTSGENIERSEKLVEYTVGYLLREADSFRNLVKLSDTEYTLDSHSVNVCTFALGLARQVGVNDEEELAALGMGALLHDVGKTRIDARIMKKRSPLSHTEFELMKKHVGFGVEIFSELRGIPKAALIPVLQHNEREDGSGYPGGLTGDSIHLFGKITAIADVFDAMTTDRVFRKAFTAYDAFKVMLGLPLDQRLLLSFIELMGPDSTH